MLRATLARYTAEPPAALRFAYTAAGKPSLAGAHYRHLCFNLTHSHNLALLALTQNARIGVDVERIADANYPTIIRQFFAASEQDALNALPPEQRRAAFYRCWVCKEAFIKACGATTELGLDRFAVSVAPDAPAALLHVAGDAEEAGIWRLAAFTPAEGFVAALCVADEEKS
jgi:4'-phosphopantetheinyl transferase